MAHNGASESITTYKVKDNKKNTNTHRKKKNTNKRYV